MADYAEQIPGLYERHAAAWDRARNAGYFSEKPWIDKFLTRAPAGGAVLDIGCGAGAPIAAYVVEKGRAVTGVDASASLIALCRARMPDQTWIVEDMRALALDAQFAGVLAWDSLFHLTPDDQRAMFPIFARHCAPGGVVMFTSGGREGEAIGAFENEPLYHGSLAPEEYERRLQDAGFRIVECALNDPDARRDAIWLAQRI